MGELFGHGFNSRQLHHLGGNMAIINVNYYSWDDYDERWKYKGQVTLRSREIVDVYSYKGESDRYGSMHMVVLNTGGHLYTDDQGRGGVFDIMED